MVRNAAIGLAAFVAGVLITYVLSGSGIPQMRADQVSMRFDALDDAVTSLERTLRSEAWRPSAGLLGARGAEQAGGTLEQEIALMREELHRILEAVEARHELLAAAEDREDPASSAANEEAQQRSWAIVNDALAAGRWTQDDARNLRDTLRELSTEQGDEILGTLVNEANRGKITLEGSNWLF